MGIPPWIRWPSTCLLPPLLSGTKQGSTLQKLLQSTVNHGTQPLGLHLSGLWQPPTQQHGTPILGGQGPYCAVWAQQAGQTHVTCLSWSWADTAVKKTGANLGCEMQVARSLGNSRSSRVASDTTEGGMPCAPTMPTSTMFLWDLLSYMLLKQPRQLCSSVPALTRVFSFRRRKTQSPSLPLSPLSLTVLLCPVPGGEAWLPQ